MRYTDTLIVIPNSHLLFRLYNMKTYTMMGNNTPSGKELGVIPRLCKGLLSAAQVIAKSGNKSSSISSLDALKVVSVELSVSYYEIYNEIVHDLLSTSSEISSNVTESKDGGAMIENLRLRKFESYADVASILEEGNKRRTIVATEMKSTSSRSHTVLTVYVKQELAVVPPVNAVSPAKIPSISTVTRLSKVKQLKAADKNNNL